MMSVYTYIGVVFVSSDDDVQNCSALIDECVIVPRLLPKLEWLHDYNCQYIFESNIHLHALVDRMSINFFSYLSCFMDA